MINESLNLLLTNLLSPLPLAFLIGMAATLLKSELEFPAPVLNAMSIYLVLPSLSKGALNWPPWALRRLSVRRWSALPWRS